MSTMRLMVAFRMGLPLSHTQKSTCTYNTTLTQHTCFSEASRDQVHCVVFCA